MPTFDYCRLLQADGQVYNEPLEVYRGDMLSYTVKSIEWGARHILEERSDVGFTIRKYKPMSEEDKARLNARRKRNRASI